MCSLAAKPSFAVVASLSNMAFVLAMILFDED